MEIFNNVISVIQNVLSDCSVEVISRSTSNVEFKAKILEETVNIMLIKTSLTGSERPKPQIRVFTSSIIEKMNESLSRNERFFCLISCTHTQSDLKLDDIDPKDYLISLESDWNNAAGRIDVRSIYDFINHNDFLDYIKINKSQHNARSILQASVFTLTTNGLEHLKKYLSYFDSRIISQILIPLEESFSLPSKGINKIYFGAPGTGKSYGIQKFIRENGLPDYDEKISHNSVFRTTLHPEYTYYDFVGQVMPKVRSTGSSNNDTEIVYDFVPNIFTNALLYSLSEGIKDTKPVFLIIEEMSRANVAAVFGDLFQLLDRNPMTGESEYKINNDLISSYLSSMGIEDFASTAQIYIPNNLFIVGTVNTNDQNVFVMDTAFKRRFEFEYINANVLAYDETTNVPLNQFGFTLKSNEGTLKVYEWHIFYRAFNKFITKKIEYGGLGLKEDKQLGQFFIKFTEDEFYNYNQIKGKLLHYMYDDVETISYTDASIFSSEINSFSEAYIKFSNYENIFSEAFIEEYNIMEDNVSLERQ